MIKRRTILTAAAAAPFVLSGRFALAAGLPGAPKPFDKGGLRIALVRYLSTGDFFQAYLAGVERQAKALGIELRVFDSRQDAALQREMLEQAVGLGVDGIIVQHGLTETMKDAVARAVDGGMKVVAFDVNCENPKVPQIEQSDRDLARLALEQAVKDNGNAFPAGYVYVAGIAPLDRRDETWQKVKAANPGIREVARWGTMDNPIANAVANQTGAVLRANPGIKVVFAPYDEFAKGVKIAVDEAGRNKDIKIYSADISTADIQAMREPDSAWVATAATNPAVVGEVCVRALAVHMTGEFPGQQVIVPPTLITRSDLIDKSITNMQDLGQKMPQFEHADVVVPKWLPLPRRG
ncbi:substrate-binding domain-containing protein [Phreatobacter stygius]|uniref:Sugar ABC transporter substrate-binding protein n=1 Tax=Phreatobacter stygius TaxID=1940610 RepID=A0A4D7B2H4_9HYPH|nr:substrate-binding domain-containing protein [Phreatobacter stygius]QCI63736.1 sugar ABC transporter substrate-binding protein [Phreatobacter stygius]